jgi:hypothetical protein
MITNLTRYLSEALPKLRREESSIAEELRLVDSNLRIHLEYSLPDGVVIGSGWLCIFRPW